MSETTAPPTTPAGPATDRGTPAAGQPRPSGRRSFPLRRIGSRLTHLLLVLVAVTFLSFVVVDLLPGDAAVVVAGDNATPEQVQQVREQLQLDRPLVVRYVDWLGGVVTGDLGQSFRTGQPVAEALAERIPVSLELTIIAQVLALLVAVPLAIYSAYRPGRLLDRASMTAGFGGAAMPQFVLGMVLIVLFAGGFSSILPATGFTPFLDDPGANLRSIVLPCLTLMVAEAAVYRQLLRSDMISTLQEDFILMARSKGLSPRSILLRHALRPSSFSLITLSGLNIGRLLGGTVIVETLFAIPGLGQLIVQAVFNRDYMLLQGALLFVAVAYVVINMLIDLLYLFLDPRVRRDA
ncbi:ABC transporter permease [Pseudonocardia endophytica]|uniref:Peptide/nickel transport system permease protein n=1 Tax=Pseudonocardia endophytica TaxID=401976 RepID=A0A4R1HIV6_PSEEN|nr:ABC transporter permease [Pseudonocardia endophytica]TCK22234.1 peptide/nickel transport system permease protein [Pseudonocardia endophytica]